MHSSLQTHCTEWIFIDQGHASEYNLQSIHVDCLRVFFNGLNQLNAPQRPIWTCISAPEVLDDKGGNREDYEGPEIKGWDLSIKKIHFDICHFII